MCIKIKNLCIKLVKKDYYILERGTALAQWLKCCATNQKVAGSIPASVSGFCIDIKCFRSHYGPGIDSASNRNEYQDYFLGGKSGRCVRLSTYHHPVPLSRNLGTLTSWNPLGHSRPVMGLLYLYILEKFLIAQILKECPAFYSILRFVEFLTMPRDYPKPSAWLDHSNILSLFLFSTCFIGKSVEGRIRQRIWGIGTAGNEN